MNVTVVRRKNISLSTATKSIIRMMILSIVAERIPQLTFQLSEYGNYSDNAFSADSPSPQQLPRSHAQVPGKVFFPCGFKIKEHRDWGAGHNFLFSGICSWFFCHR